MANESEKNGLPFELGVFDLDGTVLRRDLEITDRTRAAMDELRRHGVRLVVATGRRFGGAREHSGRLGFAGKDPLICFGGSMVRRMNGETLLHHTLPGDLGVEVLEWAAERSLHARVFVDERVITSPDTPAAFKHL
ncbi:MAG TPA: HAD family hydrolase, partial [Rubrobacteraceae bacterium]